MGSTPSAPEPPASRALSPTAASPDASSATEQAVPLAEIEVADSRFIAYCMDCRALDDAFVLQKILKAQHPDAAHVPVVALKRQPDVVCKWSEDGEPENSVLPAIKATILEQPGGAILAVGVVRYFGDQLLGVTCGRLSQCYAAVTRLALHRQFHGATTPMHYDLTQSAITKDLYGIAAGDAELILNVIEETAPDTRFLLVSKLIHELNFDGFQGAKGEELPRLQNLQATSLENGAIIPVYRYPGNYQGDEWDTFDWSPTTKRVKAQVEKRLQPLVHQTMNHCVTNFYRDGKDHIAHHSDKDLDLNHASVIVSVSLGDERILELRRRAEPRDITRIRLPHGSMLVMGPKTNKRFTHSILANEDSTMPRISLTLRNVTTYMDLRTGRLFGQGVETKDVADIRNMELVENGCFLAGFCALSSILLSKRRARGRASDVLVAGGVTGAFFCGMHFYRNLIERVRRSKQERAARDFFSKASTTGTKY